MSGSLGSGQVWSTGRVIVHFGSAAGTTYENPPVLVPPRKGKA